jgi:AraC-like DNA-binding protein
MRSEVDVLSEVLRAVKLHGAVFFNGEFSAPWCFTSARSSEVARQLRLGADHVIVFHFLTEGRAFAALGRERQELCAGDIVMIPHGDEHMVGNGSPAKPVDSMTTFAKNVREGLKVVRYGGGGEVTRFVCGYLACDPRLSQVFLAGLPRVMKVRVGGDQSGQWLEHAIRFSVNQASAAGAGANLVISKLSEVLFIETLRRYVNGLPSDQTGWLAGTRDQVIGQTLALMHQAPADEWTIATLARRVGLSRTRLAERFRHFLGQSPMAYLTEWRLRLGAEMLETTESSVAEVAASVGYGSEAAFSRAFKREFGHPPAQFRRKQKSELLTHVASRAY